jgi:hypothetical protein
MRSVVSAGLVAITAIGIAGCINLDSPSDNSSAGCTITITGAAAIAGTYTCPQPAVAIWVTNTDVGAVSLYISATKSVTGLFVFPGQPTAGATYTTDKNPSSLQAYGFVVSVGAASWSFNAGDQKTPIGSGSLTFSSVVLNTAGATGATYVTHGTIDGNLVPAAGTSASGNATMHIDF